MRSFNHILFAVAACAALLASCNKLEDKIPRKAPVIPEETPTEDAVSNLYTEPSFFLGTTFSQEFKALQRRLITIANALQDESLRTLVVPAGQLATLNTENYPVLRDLIRRGGNIVVLTPDASSIRTLSIILGETISIPTLPPKDHDLEVMGIKRGKTYFAFGEKDGSASSRHFGQKADALVDWLRKPSNSVNMKSWPNDDPAEQALQDLVASEEITIDLGFPVKLLSSNGKWWERTHDVTLIYRIWKAHSFDDNTDYYCIKEEITAYNNNLDCGPDKTDEWIGVSEDWSLWANAMDDACPWYGIEEPLAYGPYMKYIHIKNKLSSDSQQAVTTVAYDPENSTTGGATVTESFSYSLGGNMGAGMSGPSAGVSLGLSWGTTVSQFSPDLSATAVLDKEGTLQWNYEGPHSASHYNIPDQEHDMARSIQTNTCTLHQAWVWKIPSSGPGKVKLEGTFDVADEWLSYWLYGFETTEVYLQVKNVQTWSYEIATPPQYKQEWSMTIKPYNKGVEDYLISHLGGDYYWGKSTFFSLKQQHTAADTDDEISAYVAGSKAMFDKNPDLMKQAAEAGGVTDGFTIVWQNLTGPSEDGFEYEVKLQ